MSVRTGKLNEIFSGGDYVCYYRYGLWVLYIYIVLHVNVTHNSSRCPVVVVLYKDNKYKKNHKKYSKKSFYFIYQHAVDINRAY